MRSTRADAADRILSGLAEASCPGDLGRGKWGQALADGGVLRAHRARPPVPGHRRLATGAWRLTAAALLVFVAAAAGLIAATLPAAAAGSLVNPTWSVSATTTSAGSVSYTFTFTTATSGTLDAVTMLLSASGVGGSPTVGTVTPASVATGGAVTLTGGNSLTYTFTSAAISAGTPVSIQINGMTNPGSTGSDTAAISTCTNSTCSTAVDTGTTAPAVFLSQNALLILGWSASSTTTGATSTSYTYTFTTVSSVSTLTNVKMTVPPGTGGTPSAGTVTGVPSGGTMSLSGDVLTYTFSSTSVGLLTAVSIQVNGLTNTVYAGSYEAEIVTVDNVGAYHDSGYTAAVSFTGNLSSPAWSASSTAVGATGTSYTYTFTTGSSSYLTKVTMTVPLLTAGTPAVGTVTPASVASGGSVSLSGTTLTYTFTATTINTGTAVSIQITGLTNTSAAGTYTSTITTVNGSATVDSGVTSGVTMGALTLTSPSSLTWTVTLSGTDQAAVDTTAADQQLTVSDTTLTGAGWHITVAATQFTSGTYNLANAGTLVFTGSTTSATASTAPTATCVSLCTLPTDTTTYPVAITTAASSPTTYTVYDTSALTGLDAVTIGGSTAANPVGWWVNIPAKTYAATYTSTVTLAIVSGP
jgi:hypothetical protein